MAAAAIVLSLLQGCGYLIPAGVAALLGATQGSSSRGGVIILTDKDADLVVSRGAFDIGDTSEGRGAKAVVVAQFRISPTKDMTLRTLTLTATGTGNASTVPTVRLFQDVSGEGIFDPGDKQVGAISTFAGGSARSVGVDLKLERGKPADLLVVIDLPENAKDGDSFGFEIASADSVDAFVTDENRQERKVNVFGLPFQSGAKTISSVGSVRLFVGRTSPPNQTAFPNAQNVPLLQVELRTSSVEPVRVTKLTLKTSGNGDDAKDVLRANLYLDVDSDGKLAQGLDQAIVLSALPSANDGDLVFDGVAQTLQPGTVVRWIVLYDLRGTAPDGATFRVDLTSGGDVAASGITSQAKIVPTGAPLNGGATITVARASLAVSRGPFNQDRSATPGATNVPVLHLTLAAGPAEPLIVSGIAIKGSGGGNEPTDVAGVRLFLDQNGDGAAGQGEPLLAGPATFSSDDGKIVLSGFAREIAPGTTESWVVTYDVANGAAGNDQFFAALAGAADVSVVGKTSGLVIAPTVDTSTGGRLVVTGSVSLAPGPNPPPAQAPFANSQDVPVLQVRLAAGPGEPVRVTSIVVKPSGAGNDATAISAVDLIDDADQDGQFTPGVDTILATAAFPGDDAPLTFSSSLGLIPGDVPANGQRVLLVRYWLSGQAQLGDDFRASTDPPSVTATGTLSGVSLACGGVPVSGATATAQRARLTLAIGPQNPGDSDVLNGVANVPVLQVRVTAGPSEAVDVSSVTIRGNGTAQEPQAVQGVDLYVDSGTTPGAVDGLDVKLGTTQAYASNDGFVKFDGAGPPLFTVAAGASVDLLVAYSISPFATVPGNVRARVDADADVAASGQTSFLSSQVLGAPVLGGLKTLRRGSLALSAGAQNRVAGNVFPNVVAFPMLQLKLQAGFAESVRVSRIVVRLAGSADESVAVGAVHLVDDQNGDGIPDPLEPVFNADSATILDDGQVTFQVNLTPGALDVAAGGVKHLLVTFDLSGNAVPPGDLRARIQSAADVVATGLSSAQPIVPSGAPVDGNAQTLVLGSLALSTTATNPGATTELPNASGIAMLQIRLVTGSVESVKIGSLTVTNAGATAQGPVTQAELYRDVNANGILDADTLLATATFSGNVATFTKVGGLLDVAASSTAHLLVVYQLSGSANEGDTFQARVLANADVGVSGNSSSAAIVPSGAPLSGSLKTIQKGRLAVAAGAQNPPPPATVFANQAGAPIVQVTLSAGSAEAIRVGSATFRSSVSSTLDPQNGVTQVRLYRENDPPDGVLNGDSLLGTAANFGPTGAMMFSIATGALDVPAGSSKTLLLVCDFGGTAAAGQTLSAEISSSADLSCQGVVSMTAVTPTGVPPAISGQKTVIAASLAVSTGPAPPSAGSVFRTQANVPLLQLRLDAGLAEAVAVTSLKLTASGSLNAQTGVVGLKLFRDDNANGLPDDFVLATATAFGASNDVTFAIAPGALQIPAGGSKNVLLACDFGGTAAGGQTLTASFAANGDVAAQGVTSGLAIAATGAPVAGATKQVVDRTLAVASGAALPSPQTVFNNAKGVRALAVRFTAGAVEAVRLTSLTVRDLTAATSHPGTVVKLYLDQDDDGAVGGADTLLATGTYAANPGSVTFDLTAVATPVDVPAGGTIALLATYDVSPGAVAGDAFQARVNAAGDVVGKGAVSQAPAVVSGTFPVFPALGATINVQSTTLTLQNPGQPPSGNVFANAQGVSMVRVQLAAGALEGVRVTDLKIRPGAATTGNHTLASASLYVDVNQNGVLDVGTDVLAAGPLPGPAGGGFTQFTNAGGLVDVPAGATRQLLVIYDFPQTAPFPNAGDVFDVSVAAADVAAKGLGSSAPVAATGGPLAGGAKTIVKPSLALSASAQTPAANVLKNAQSVPMLRFTLAAGAPEPVRVTQVTLRPGSASPSNHALANVRLFLDANGNGALDPGDTLLGGPIPGGPTEAFTGGAGGLVQIPANGSASFLAVYDFPGPFPGIGDAFNLGVAAADVAAEGASSTLAVAVSGGPLPGGTKTIAESTLALAAGTNPPLPPADGNVFLGQTNVAILQVKLSVAASGPETVRVTAIQLQGTGTNMTADVAQARLLRDDGVVLGSPAAFAGGVVSFSPATGTLDVAPGGSRQVILVIDVAPGATSGDTIAAQVASTAAVQATGVVSLLVVPVTPPPPPPITGATKTVAPAPRVTVDQAPVPPPPLQGTTVGPNATNVPMLQVRLRETTGNGDATLTALTVHASGTPGDDAADVSLVRLWVDADASGDVSTGDIQVGLTKYFTDNGVATFGGLNVLVPMGGPAVPLLVTYDMSGSPTTGSSYQASVQTAADFAITSAAGAIVPTPSPSFPMSGPLRTVPPLGLTAATGAQSPTGTLDVRDGSTGLVMFQLTLTANAAGAVTVNEIDVGAVATFPDGNDSTGVARLTLVRDVDGDGTVGPGDVTLATVPSPFPANNGTATITGLSEVVPIASTVSYLVVYDLSAAPVANDRFQAFLSNVVASAPVTGAPLPATGRTLRAVGGLTIALGANNPAPQWVPAATTNVVVLEVRLTADPAEDMLVSAITFTASGTADARQSWLNGKLYRDNGDGIFSGVTDTLIGGNIPIPFTNTSPSTCTFPSLGQAIGAGSTVNWWFVLDLTTSPPVVPGATFRASVVANPDVSATGQTSSTTGFVSGAPVTGNLFGTGIPAQLLDVPVSVPLLAGAGFSVMAMGAADLNRDGKLDLVLLLSDGRIEVRMGNGDGTFAIFLPSGVYGSNQAGPQRIAVGDVNRDGWPDVVAVYDAQVIVFTNDGVTGALAPGAPLLVGVSVKNTDVALVDYDRDGDLDVVVADQTLLAATATLRGLRNDGSGGLTATDSLVLGQSIRRMAVADYDGDSIVDVVWDDATHVNLATGNGSFFTQVQSIPFSSPDFFALVPLDADRNAFPDLAIIAEGPGQLATFKSNGPSSASFTFQFPTIGTGQLSPHDVVAADFDGDARPDLAIVHANNNVVVRLNDPTQPFLFPTAFASVYATGGSPSINPDRIVAGDWNGDGAVDVIVASSTSAAGVFRFLKNTRTSNGVVSVASPTVVPWGKRPVDVAIADWKRDGAPDFVLGSDKGVFALWRNDGSGTSFSKLPDVTLPDKPGRLRAADVNRDGKLDLVVSIPDGAAPQLAVFPGNGDGTFGAALSALYLSAPKGSGAFAIDDLDRDGKPDAVAVDADQDAIQAFLGDGTRLLDASPSRRFFLFGTVPVDVALVDLNRDGKLEAVVLNQGSRTIEVLFGIGDGTFGAHVVTSLAGMTAPSAIALGDLDRDGVLDAVVVDANASLVLVLRGNTGGSFTLSTTLAGAQGAVPGTGVVLADMDRDGRLDIVLSNQTGGPGRVVSFRNVTAAVGTTAFANGTPRSAANGGQLVALAAGDLDRDGEIDVVAADEQNQAAQVFLGQ